MKKRVGLFVILLMVFTVIVSGCAGQFEPVAKKAAGEAVASVEAEVDELKKDVEEVQTSLHILLTQVAKPTEVPAPPEPTAKPTVAATEVPSAGSTSDVGGTETEEAKKTTPVPVCRVIHEHRIDKDSTEVATSGSHIHVEFYVHPGDPEVEVVLSGPRRYVFAEPIQGGYVWEYTGCALNEVRAEVNAHISRRIADKANNAGWADEELVKQLFLPTTASAE